MDIRHWTFCALVLVAAVGCGGKSKDAGDAGDAKCGGLTACTLPTDSTGDAAASTPLDAATSVPWDAGSSSSTGQDAGSAWDAAVPEPLDAAALDVDALRTSAAEGWKAKTACSDPPAASAVLDDFAAAILGGNADLAAAGVAGAAIWSTMYPVESVAAAAMYSELYGEAAPALAGDAFKECGSVSVGVALNTKVSPPLLLIVFAACHDCNQQCSPSCGDGGI